MRDVPEQPAPKDNSQPIGIAPQAQYCDHCTHCRAGHRCPYGR